MSETQYQFSPAEPSLRERKKARTAQKLEEAALRLFLAQGFDGTTLEEVAEAADIHKQTLLRYFPTKEDLAFARRRRIYEGFAESLGDRTTSVIEHWRQAMLESATEGLKRGDLLRWYAFVDSDQRLAGHNLLISMKYQALLVDALSAEAGVDPRTDYFSRLVAAMLVRGVLDVFRATMDAQDEKNLLRNINATVDMAASLRREDFASRAAADPASGRPAPARRASTRGRG
jgi:AcrR family transcriptional regulator